MSINLGLSRITKLLEHVGNPHRNLRVIHIAGTNGKGSVCSYLTSILQQKRSVGKFTTPHLCHITDSITINNIPISSKLYNDLRTSLESLNVKYQLECTEFELLTCTALKYFSDTRCSVCVIEVGLGGRLDATNVIPGDNKLACGITKIGLDHESILGNTLSSIASEKAGIITKGLKYVVIDGSNNNEVIKVVRERSEKIGCTLIVTNPNKKSNFLTTKSWGEIEFDKLPLNGEYQIYNLDVAISILDALHNSEVISINRAELKKGLSSVTWPGRLQELELNYSNTSKYTIPILLDGAHNGAAAIELNKYIRGKYGERPLLFMIAITKGKEISTIFKSLIRPCDKVIVTQFDKVEGMPWIKATDPNELADIIRKGYTQDVVPTNSIETAVNLLASIHKEDARPTVVCGSLYLCGQLLNLHNSNTKNN
ncbi:hypothetical protein Kpol_297p9 [Vanderwaltozyma polyspora DSM 70294]|uniref:Dihydrofolate synthetase n=1 Tax=Vanderwaltozyma polyspora (strain ATCC 22028 / DSM 70294 / BCRC 21397 / CBS 2163 / NBRC 10782 / NRRL Y-8283 / UCD 57-17) TaxID=436907 RepID=A7TSL3_VANPO|nr:uncharacterized protein Kpol_297p9 [Vanderwaltozyma polyspora DSM 70294]EDO14748.1 hypothetical protein Kpol_297p9 [Vanderwaltozyma polyspora DSM 70294]